MRIKFYIINLSTSKYRRQYVLNEMKKFHINNFEFIDGFNAKEYRRESLEKVIDKKKFKHDIQKGMIGCSISHIKALRRFLCDSDSEIGVILEDDFKMFENPEKYLKLAGNPILDQGPILLYSFVKERIIFKKEKNIGDGYGLYEIDPPVNFLSTVGYSVNKKSAEKLIRTMYPLIDFPDGWNTYFLNNGFKRLFVFYPFFLSHEVFESDRIEMTNQIIKLKTWVTNIIISKKYPFIYQLIKRYRRRWRDPDHDKIIFK